MFETIPAAGLYPTAAALLLFGIASCFCGYRIFRLVLAVTGALAGGGTLGAVGLILTRGHWLGGALGFAVGGLIGAFLLVYLYDAGVFLLGAAAGFIGGSLFLPTQPTWVFILGLVITTIAGAGLAWVMQKFILIVATALVGSGCLTLGAATFVYGHEIESVWTTAAFTHERLLMLIVWVCFSICGVFSQYHVRRRRLAAGKPDDLDLKHRADET